MSCQQYRLWFNNTVLVQDARKLLMEFFNVVIDSLFFLKFQLVVSELSCSDTEPHILHDRNTHLSNSRKRSDTLRLAHELVQQTTPTWSGFEEFETDDADVVTGTSMSSTDVRFSSWVLTIGVWFGVVVVYRCLCQRAISRTKVNHSRRPDDHVRALIYLGRTSRITIITVRYWRSTWPRSPQMLCVYDVYIPTEAAHPVTPRPSSMCDEEDTDA